MSFFRATRPRAARCVANPWDRSLGGNLRQHHALPRRSLPTASKHCRKRPCRSQTLFWPVAAKGVTRGRSSALKKCGLIEAPSSGLFSGPGIPSAEVANVTAANVDVQNGLWILKQHKTLHKTGKPRIIYLTPSMLEMSKRLMQKHPDGPLFRSSRGKAFSRNAIRCRFKRLRDKSPILKGVVAYSYRHAFATDALVHGVGIAQVAELMGHTSTELVSRVYSHISMNVGHLREAAVRATQAPPAAS